MTPYEPENIGLAVSGGGYRATVFHLGVLTYLAEEGLLERIRFISSVSGGSLAIGLVFRANDFAWPNSEEYRHKFIPFARDLLTSTNLQLGIILDTISNFAILPSRAWLVSRRLKKDWGIDIPLQGLPENPRWIINATSAETGRNWRFERKRMGDYVFGYSMEPDYQLSDAIAASAGFPILIGAITLSTGKYRWVRYHQGSRAETEPIEPIFSRLHLWDGGLHDNLGLEPLVNYGNETQDFGYREGINCLFVSNASGKLSVQKCAPGLPTLKRLILIPQYQSQALRSREMIHRLRDHGFNGRYFMLGNHASHILRNAKISQGERNILVRGALSQDDVAKARDYDTNIKRVKPRDFDILLRHGYETAKFTILAYAKDG
ncbi:MAG: patatin-like phospholipase family protein [Anaerolineae bacterium]|nr:patatin-like phospholipase family protein [Anaerolineae bacterium]